MKSGRVHNLSFTHGNTLVAESAWIIMLVRSSLVIREVNKNSVTNADEDLLLNTANVTSDIYK